MKKISKLLTELVKRHGPRNWSYIADHIRGRMGMSCRLRWLNHLNPKVDKTPFSKEEQERLLELHWEFGNKWSAIVSFFPGRTDNQLKNLYRGLVGSRNMSVSGTSSSTSRQGCLNKGSVDLSSDIRFSKLAVGPQFSDVAQPGNKCSVCGPCLTFMPDETKIPLFRGGSSSIYGRDDNWFAPCCSNLSRNVFTSSICRRDGTWFANHFPNLSRDGAHSSQSISHGIMNANPATSHGVSMISDARSARFSQCCPVARPRQGASIEKYLDFFLFCYVKEFQHEISFFFELMQKIIVEQGARKPLVSQISWLRFVRNKLCEKIYQGQFCTGLSVLTRFLSGYYLLARRSSRSEDYLRVSLTTGYSH